MEKMTMKELAIPMIKAIDSFNYLLKNHHRRTAVIAYYLGKEMQLSKHDLFILVVAASLHDIGALSVQERNKLIQEDVENPGPHCIMGWNMLSSFDAFREIAQVIKHHHIHYQESLNMEDENIPIQSHIIHLADRVDILISPDKFILDQKKEVTDRIRQKIGIVLNPLVFEAFEKVSKPDIFWIEINNLDIDQLFRRLNFSIDFVLSIENILEFSHTISRIIDFRSQFTASHSYTVAHLAYLLGGYFGYSEEKCKKLMIAGYLHDIGKIGIDPGLIEKNGPLTDPEFNIMKLHTYYTGQILQELSSSDWFKEIIKWAELHHEKSDGSGYPFALTYQNLDDEARILSYSDVITALLEDRPYRKPLSLDKAFKIIDEKIASNISPVMYTVIEKNKEEINELVLQCQAHTYNEYRTGFPN